MLFNLLFYVNIIVRMIVALPTIVLPRSFMLGVLRRYARSSLWLLRVVCGVTVEWRGREKIPEGACIVACKHQSFWETFAFSAMTTAAETTPPEQRGDDAHGRARYRQRRRG